MDANSLDNGNDLQSDSVAETHVLKEIQISLQQLTRNLDLDQVVLLTIPSDFCFVAFGASLKLVDYDEPKSFDYNINKFIEDQAHIFNSILNKILREFTVTDPQSP